MSDREFWRSTYWREERPSVPPSTTGWWATLVIVGSAVGMAILWPTVVVWVATGVVAAIGLAWVYLRYVYAKYRFPQRDYWRR